jgi:uncharacterized protein (DUF427 family)
MTLTVEHAPFSPKASGCFNVEIDRTHEVLFWDPVPHRVRAILAGRTVVDSRSVVLLHETGRLPVYYFPGEDVRSELLERSSRTSDCPNKGRARYWNVRVEDRVAPDAIWEYPEPIDSASFLAGYLALDWRSFDEWFVEDEQVFGHPRDPYSRIDVYTSTRQVRVVLDGEVLADTRRPKILFETSLPPRYYLPAADVRTELLVPSSTKSRCAYKGSASYWHVRLGDRLIDDLVWSYPDPQHDGEPVRDLLCFFDERVDIELDGAATERPVTRIIDRGRESGLVE